MKRGPTAFQIRQVAHLPWNDAVVVAVAGAGDQSDHLGSDVLRQLPSFELGALPVPLELADFCHPGDGDLAASDEAADEAGDDVKVVGVEAEVEAA